MASQSKQFLIERTFRPHAMISNAAHGIVKHATKEVEGRTNFLIAAMTLEAFVLEGYVNLVGGYLYADEWDERKLFNGSKEKIRKVLKKADPDADFGTPPYNSIDGLMKFRDSMAHPKHEEIKKRLTANDVKENERKHGQWVPASIEEYVAVDNVERVRGHLDEIIKRTWNDEWSDLGPEYTGYSMMKEISPS